MSESDRELFERAQRFQRELADWTASQDASKPSSDSEALTRPGRTVEDVLNAGITKHVLESERDYKERFVPQAMKLYDDLIAAGLTPSVSRQKYEWASNAVAAQYVIRDLDAHIKELESRL